MTSRVIFLDVLTSLYTPVKTLPPQLCHFNSSPDVIFQIKINIIVRRESWEAPLSLTFFPEDNQICGGSAAAAHSSSKYLLLYQAEKLSNVTLRLQARNITEELM